MMKKAITILLSLALLLPLTLPAAAESDTALLTFDGLRIRATGYSTTPGADGAERLTVFLEIENRGDQPRELRSDACLVGNCELPVCLAVNIGAGESAEAAAVVPLAALAWLGLPETPIELVRLRFSSRLPDADALPVYSEWVPLRVGALPLPKEQERDSEELYVRFGARVLTLGADWDGRYFTGWFLLENNNDFPLRLSGGWEETGSALCGGTVRARSTAAFRVDLPADQRPAARTFTLNCTLEGYADGADRPPVAMGSFKALLYTRVTNGQWTLHPSGESESLNDQSYIARVGHRDFAYDQCAPALGDAPDAPALPLRDSGLISLACCGGFEILAQEERLEGARLVLPLTLRSFTGESLALQIVPNRDFLWLPCLTAGALEAGAGGSASADFVFDAGGLAYTELTGETRLTHGFTMLVGPADNLTRSYDSLPAERSCACAELAPLTPCEFEGWTLGALAFRLLGLELDDGFALWLAVRNDTDEDLPFGEQRVDAMLNSSLIGLYNSGSLIPARSECLVLLRGAVFPEQGAPDALAFRTPALSELNTLKLRLTSGEEGLALTLMFQQNGNIMFASAV